MSQYIHMLSVLNIRIHGAEGSGLWHDYLSVEVKFCCIQTLHALTIEAILYNHIRIIYCIVSACVNQSYMCSAGMIDMIYFCG